MQISNLERNLLALLELKGVGPAAIKRNLGKIALSSKEMNPLETLTPIFGEKIDQERWLTAVAKADRTLDRCARVGIDVVSIFSPDYPSLLKELGTSPPVLFCRGNRQLWDRPPLGVIGTRTPTPFGVAVARRIGRHFSGVGIPLCNGLADGIDLAAIAPDAGVLPMVVGVMASGLDILEEKVTARRVSERAAQVLEAGGLLVSELAPGEVEDQNTVIASCRIQAGLSKVLLLVQSSDDGGSRFAIEHFSKFPRSMAFIVPPEAHARDPMFTGNRRLQQGEAGLAAFVGLRTTKSLRSNLVPINSKADYDVVLSEFVSQGTKIL